jgi:uncharacterized membrane-anchored protein YhcB (DUF1043 family)
VTWGLGILIFEVGVMVGLLIMGLSTSGKIARLEDENEWYKRRDRIARSENKKRD